MEELTPQQKAQIQQNVAKMRAAGKSEDDVIAYLRYEAGEGDAPAFLAGPGQPGAAPAVAAPPPESTLKGFGRSVAQHGLMNFGDELGLIDQTKQDAFARDHKVLNFIAALGGGSIAPIAAILAAPELATVGGAAAIGGATGLLSGAGEGTDLESRAHDAAIGGVTGMAGGAAGNLLGTTVGKVGGVLADAIHPERQIAREAGQLLTPEMATKAARINRLAPGGANAANSSASPSGIDNPMLSGIVKMVGRDAGAAAGAQGDLEASQTALQESLGRIGQKIAQNEKTVEVTPEVRSAIAKARSIIGDKYTPNIPGAPPTGANPLGLDQSIPFEFETAQTKITTTELHELLSRMRSTLSNYRKRGIDAPGQRLHDVVEATDAVKKVLYDASPRIAKIDRSYAAVAEHILSTESRLEDVQRARINGA